MHRLIMDTNKNKERPPNPRANANIFEVLSFSWMVNLFKLGRKRRIDEEDLYTTLMDHRSSKLGDELEKEWRIEVENAKMTNRKPSLLRALIQMFGAQYMYYGFKLFIDEIILKMSQPIFISGILAYFSPHGSNKSNLRYAYICASGLVLSMLTSMVLHHSTVIELLNSGMKMRIACCSIIYRKALRLSHKALDETTVGQMINLLSNDVNHFDLASSTLHYLWLGPLQTVVVTYFLWQEIGVSSLFGVALLFFFIPLQGWLGKKISELRLKTAIRTDERVRLMNEIISGIQLIKMYTWEKPFTKLIEYARMKEIQQIRGASYIRSILLSFIVVQTRFQLFISILSYSLLGNYITIQKVFVMTSFYSLLQLSMTNCFTKGVSRIVELQVSIERIKNFLLHDERDCHMSENPKPCISVLNGYNKSVIYNDSCMKNDIVRNRTEYVTSKGIVVYNATAKWNTNQTVNSLENINLTVEPDWLVTIIGPVGAGKSSLFQAILRELPLFKGRISVCGVISYASQEPWLFAGSIQQNILFDSPMNKKRYNEVIKVCALKNDIDQFPYGDRTIVGERGVTLSGGQRARINLARAVYKQADIYLLDDPLSAVDTRVGQYLFKKCIKGYLKEKCCVLITHQIQYLTNEDHIVLMDNGNVLAKGSYQELQASGFDSTKLLRSPENSKIAFDHEVNDKNIEFLDKHHILFPYGSNESIASSVEDVKHRVNLLEPKQEPENLFTGHVTKNVYTSYFAAVGSTYKVGFCFFIFILTQILMTSADYWITFWVHQEEYVFRYENVMYNVNNTSKMHDSYDTIIIWSSFRQTCVIVYTVIIISLIATILIRSSIFVSVFTGPSINLHHQMFNSIIRTTMLFFNTNSSGRIFNRFSKDIGAIDEVLPFVSLECLQMFLMLLGIIFVVGLVNMYLIIPTLIVALIFYQFRGFFVPTTRCLKRLETLTRSPVFAHMNVSIQGLTTIRAHKAEQVLSEEFDKYQDLHSTAWYLFLTSNQSFGFWMDVVCVIYISIVTFTFLCFSNNTHGEKVGLAVTQSILLIGKVQWGIRQFALLENEMMSVERILEYAKSPQEASLQSSPDKVPPTEWPKFGKIVFQNFNLRYNSNASYVLKNLNIKIQHMEKVGIVGRTGAGKSSIISALFRLALNEGNIFIDDKEIHELGLHDLRSKFSIIPQEPVLFSGTMRTNLDPFDEYPDHVLWNALDEVELKIVIENLPGGLNSKMSECGSNLSVGQKQLVCLARALLRNNKILILDEATANVDQQTDRLIQNTIRNKFRTCTVLTIAHRLNTVMDSDRILVMDAGTVVEFDHAYNLLKNEEGFLYKMVKQTGQAAVDLMHSMAAESYDRMRIK